MSRTKLAGILVMALVSGAVGVLVVHAEFFSNTTVVNSKSTIVAPHQGWLEQHIRAADQTARQSADQGMRDDCAALRKMGATNPNCPPQ